ncbi:MAG: aminotransferase class V-fold PLP-dependent enzyme, partial [Candidatus Marinimicrobia bacterium]|nr:aminotransferase class V-fold PLP-dependent enzyme [Candidatus Neomarinimicrobiota bacterium]
MPAPIPTANSVYLDHHASTPLLPEVRRAMEPWLEKGFGNPSNILHEYGREARKGVNWARQQVAALINAEPDEIIFTSGATEANNMLVRGVPPLLANPGLLISTLEHESVAKPAQSLTHT